MEIKFKDLNLQKNEKTILKNINLEIPENKITFIVGKSGQGKTSLVEVINFLQKPTSGTMRLDDPEITNLKELHFNVGYVFSKPKEQLLEETVGGEISFAIKSFDYKVEQLEARVLSALKMVGLDKELVNRKLNTLSTGELKKVQIASVLVHNPKLLILDEPTYGLDDRSIIALIKTLTMLKKKYNKTIIVISNNMYFLHRLADEVIVMDKAEIFLKGTTEEVFKEVNKLNKIEIDLPPIVEFISLVKDKKNIDLGKHIEVKDLIKDVYRNV